ncbi:MAG: DNA polymerase III subunit alpha [Paludibacteraceae bacterium]|nr:DNA polymerase III subunit alpha [Paludibacteraceae bacterium]
MSFVHLHVHSHYSVLDGMSKVTDLVDKCVRTGMPAMALTDHGNMYGIKELLDYSKKVNAKHKEAWEQEHAGEPYVPVFKPIVGVEAYCARRGRHSMSDERAVNGEGRQYIIDRSGWHLILLAKNMQGYRNLCRIVSMGFMEDAFNYTSRIDKELLELYHEGIICCSACLGGEIPQKIMNVLARQETDRLIAEQGVEALVQAGEVFREAEEAVLWFKNLFGEDYYIELQRHQTDKPGGDQQVFQRQREVNPVLIALAHKHGIKIICTNDTHFVEEEHAEAHDRLICLSTNHYVDDENRMHYTKQEWLKTPEEMQTVFSDLPEALANTQEIADKVELYDIDSGPIMPLFPIPEDFGTEEQYRQRFTEEQLFDEFTQNENGEVVLSEEDARKKIKKLGGYDRLFRIKLEADYLAHLTWAGAMRRYPHLKEEIDAIGEQGLYTIGWDMNGLDEKNRELVERIKFELHIMKTMGFPGYFLIVMDFIRAAREELDVSVGPGRGSAAGSVVAYCLHITDLDPLKYDLLFERFLNPDRISLPDIDTDFDDAGRGKVLDWVSNKYGQTHVAHIITYGAMAAKSAIADVGRVQRVPLARVNEIKKFVPERGFPDNIKDEKGKSPKVNLKNCYKYVDELRELYNGGDPAIRSMLDYAQQLEDTIRQVGIHACGVIIGADDLMKFAPLSSVEDKDSKKRVLVTEYDGHVVESVGLIKMDFLGLKTLTIIKECLRNIRHARGEEVDIDNISLEDEQTYQLFQEGRTIAVFQFESAGMQKYLKELRPTLITDLIAMNALYRPGPMAYIPSFIRRKHGEEPISYDIPVMEKYLKDTYGVTVYQEQVMLLSRLLAGFTRGESDKLRKAMGKKQMAILQELKGKFMTGGKANGHDEKILEKIWKDWEAFASYAFNKSHAACYAWVAYQTAYLKAHYPAEFMAANLTVAKDDITTVTKYMDECRAMKIDVLEPDVNESELNFTVNTRGAIRFGLGGIKGVGEGAVEAIIREREQNGKYKNIFDFLERVNLQACNRKTVESLAMAGAFDCFEGLYREQLLATNSKGENVLETLMRYGNRYQQDKQEQQNSLFGGFDTGVEVQRPELPQAERMSTIERLNIEKSLIGIFLSAHPLDDYEFELRDLCNMTTAQLKWFDRHRKQDEQTKRYRGVCIREWETVTAEREDDDETVTDEQKTEQKTEGQLLREFIERYQNQPTHIGGIITNVIEAVSKTGNPYGRYTIEDYSGSFEFALFGDTYKQCAPLMKPSLYVYLTGAVQQAGTGRKWFKEKPIDDAEYEFVVQNVELLKDVQSKYAHALTLNLPIDTVTPAFTDELKEVCAAHPGALALRLALHDDTPHNNITLVARGVQIAIDRTLYKWIRARERDGELSHMVN